LGPEKNCKMLLANISVQLSRTSTHLWGSLDEKCTKCTERLFWARGERSGSLQSVGAET
jgi:hypothetical protein